LKVQLLTNEPYEYDTFFFEKVLVTSYPRSGNTLIRSYLEKISGTFTGSDCDVRRPLNADLKSKGLEGEGIVDQRVWFVKTHFPERDGFCKFFAQKAIVVTRSPVDAFASLFNMIGSGTHDTSIPEEVFTEMPELWDEFIRQEVETWVAYHEYWTKAP